MSVFFFILVSALIYFSITYAFDFVGENLSLMMEKENMDDVFHQHDLAFERDYITNKDSEI
mgnify:CR=1 FL=1